jgi:hypothetical protein
LLSLPRGFELDPDMSSETTSDEESSQEDPQRYDVDDLEMIRTIGKAEPVRLLLERRFLDDGYRRRHRHRCPFPFPVAVPFPLPLPLPLPNPSRSFL